MLKVRDDGPGTMDCTGVASLKQKLGMRILQGLADQIHGTLTTELDQGREVVVEFPTFR